MEIYMIGFIFGMVVSLLTVSFLFYFSDKKTKIKILIVLIGMTIYILFKYIIYIGGGQ